MDWSSAATLSQEAFREAVNEWIGKARVQGGRVQATDAILTPGSLTSDLKLDDAIFQRLARARLPDAVAHSLAATLAGAWNEWAAGFQIRVPGAYPSFAAVPAPFARATPAVDKKVALRQGNSPGEMALRTTVLAPRLISSLAPHARTTRSGSPDEAMTGLARWVEASFQEWKAAVTIGGLSGKGPVPTYAPPYVPVGPVVMGDNTSVGPLFVGPRFGKLSI